MQIKLIQTEIEEAVRNFIQEQVSVKEGMEINITFSATRGEEGLIASVEIARAADDTQTGQTKGETVAVAPSAASAPIAEAPEKAPTAKVTRRSTTTVIPKADPVVAAAPEPEVELAVAAKDPPFEGGQEATTAGEVAEAPAAAPGKSLFGNLKQPTNG